MSNALYSRFPGLLSVGTPIDPKTGEYFSPGVHWATGKTFKTGARPSPRHKAFAAPCHHPMHAPPPQVCWFPKTLNVFGNDSYGDCCPPGTLIQMADGSLKAIEDMRVMDRVQTAEGNTGPVTALMSRYENNGLVRVVSWGASELRLTANHEVLTRRGYVPAGELIVGDWIATPAAETVNLRTLRTKGHLPEELMYGVSTRGSRRGYAASVAAQKKAIGIAISRFPETISLTPEFGRIVGMFLAEGSTNQNVVCWTFSSKERDTLATELVSHLKSELGIDARIEDHAGNSVNVRVSSKLWRMFFRSLCGVGAYGKRMHRDITCGPRDFLCAVLGGWLDGDGTDYWTGRSGTTVSKPLALGMFNLAQSLGFVASIWSRKTNRGFRFEVSVLEKESPRYIDSDRGVTKTTSGRFWAHGTTRDGKSKNLGRYDTREEALDVARKWRADNDQFGNGRVFRDDRQVWRRIRKVDREPYSGMVFNMEVAGDNSYVAEGVGVHNCVSAEEGFSKLCYGLDGQGNALVPEINLPSSVVVNWAGKHGWLNGADLTSVMDAMIQSGFQVGNQLYNDGPYSSVDWTSDSVLQSALALGPVKIAIAASVLPSGAGNHNGWFIFGNHGGVNRTDHCVAICARGPAAWVVQQLNATYGISMTLPSGISPTDIVYAVYTWATIGLVDLPWIGGTVPEAWIRNPTTVGIPPLTPPPPPTPPVSTLSIAGALTSGEYAIGDPANPSAMLWVPSGLQANTNYPVNVLTPPLPA